MAICKVLEQNVHLRGLSENSLFCIFMIFPMHSEDRNDRDQILLLSHPGILGFIYPHAEELRWDTRWK